MWSQRSSRDQRRRDVQSKERKKKKRLAHTELESSSRDLGPRALKYSQRLIPAFFPLLSTASPLFFFFLFHFYLRYLFFFLSTQGQVAVFSISSCSSLNPGCLKIPCLVTKKILYFFSSSVLGPVPRLKYALWNFHVPIIPFLLLFLRLSFPTSAFSFGKILFFAGAKSKKNTPLVLTYRQLPSGSFLFLRLFTAPGCAQRFYPNDERILK